MPYIDRSHSVLQEATSEKISAPDAQNWADRKLTSTQRADLAFRYLDWLLTKKIPSGGFRLLYVISQRFNEENPFEAYPSLVYISQRAGRSKSAVWEMLPKLAKIGAIEIEFGSQGSGDVNYYRLPAAFLEFYFGPEKGRRKQPKKVRRAELSKPRQADVSNEQKSSVEPSEKFGLPDKKVRPAVLNHFVATYKQPRAGLGRAGLSPRSSDAESQSPPNGAVAAADDESQSPAFETDIPETEREGQNLRLCSASVEDKDRAETRALEAASLPIRIAVANAANCTPIDRNGHAARRPDNQQPHHKGHDAMVRIAKDEPRPELFAKVKGWYPQEFVGNDDQLSFEAFELCIDHGVEYEELLAGAFDRMADADHGRDVPLLVEFLASKCWTEAIAA
jgi:hypothetical protein